MDALALTYHGPGVVRIERITGPDGRRSWLVAVPGVQSWGAVAGHNPFDLTSAVGAMAGRRSAPAVEVTRALEAVGAARDEPVLLAGHSLGGMVACGLAADPAFRARFRVTHVVTAGSPVALFRIPPKVRVLSLEHEEDVVPSLDGRDNPDSATWVSVRGAARADPTTRALAAVDPYVGHDIGAYTRTATRLDRSDPARLNGWRQGFARFAVPGSTVRVWEFTGQR
jgi:pimeloyl-ACP methyl ester carboxylesterase